jgi:hypothetical protein
MRMQPRIVTIAACGLLLVSTSAMRFVAPDACKLLTAADATKALEASSQPGKPLMAEGCIWSNDPAASDSSRKVALNLHSVRAFGFAKKPAIPTIKIEPVSGIGDEAFYQIYPNNQSPFIWVRKGETAFSIRILTQLKPKPFTIDQEKAKELVLAKAAVAKL